MWITYNRILNGNYWQHPDFTTTGNTEKYLSTDDNTLFLAETTKTDFTGYEVFNIKVISEEELPAIKKAFGLGRYITKAKFLLRLTFDEFLKVSNPELYITGDQATQKIASVKALWKMFDNFEKVTMSDSEWCQQFAQIVAWTGLITSERIKEILEV